MKLISLIIILISTSLFAKTTIERFALIIGANNGGKVRVRLAFAHSDAKAFSKVLKELGGIDKNDQVILLEPTQKEIDFAFEAIKNKVKHAKTQNKQTQILFYYSGHSNENGLLIGEEQLKYRKLKSKLKNLESDVQITILDSCASGAMIRQKGGKWRPSFLSDKSSLVIGHAILTSSSASETAQESNLIGGSFFTHYMISGLRGAADRSNDKKVTLNEAYEYAFHKTLKRTQGTIAGAQHPNYDFQLAGSGDLVLTDLRSMSSLLIFNKDLLGKIFIRNKKGNLIAEIDKTEKKEFSFGLEVGEYNITFKNDKTLKLGNVKLSKNQSLKINLSSFKSVPKELTISRGENKVNNEKLKYIPFAVGLFNGISMNSMSESNTLNNVSYGLIVDDGYATKGLSISTLASIKTGWLKGLQLSSVFNILTGDLYGLQVAGVFNTANNDISGLQVSGVFNRAKNVNGVQVGGILNIAKKVKGIQIGLINIADDSTFSLGLINIIKNGRFNITGLIDIDKKAFIEIKNGGSHWHMIYGAGVDIKNTDIITFDIGFGFHIPINKMFFTDIDILDLNIIDINKNFVDNDWDIQNNTIRLQFGMKINKYISVLLGTSLNITVQPGDRNKLNKFAGWLVNDAKNDKDSYDVYLYPKFNIALQFL